MSVILLASLALAQDHYADDSATKDDFQEDVCGDVLVTTTTVEGRLDALRKEIAALEAQLKELAETKYGFERGRLESAVRDRLKEKAILKERYGKIPCEGAWHGSSLTYFDCRYTWWTQVENELWHCPDGRSFWIEVESTILDETCDLPPKEPLNDL